MERINFSYNWNNKLAGRYFTTIRLKNHKYNTGSIYSICLKEKHLFRGEIIEIKELEIDQINNFIAGIDTGYTAEACKEIIKKMYQQADWKTQKLYLILITDVDNQKLMEKLKVNDNV